MYASGWDPSGVQKKCRGLPEGRRMANSQAAVFLVETSDKKAPARRDLGCEAGLLAGRIPALPDIDGSPSSSISGGSSCDGHVQRNVRLSLSAIDMVQPYVCMSKIANIGAGSLRGTHFGLQVSWYVGGGKHVNSTWASLHTSPLHSSGAHSNGYQ